MKRMIVLMAIASLAFSANAAVFLSIDGVNPSDGTEDILDGGGTVIVYVMDDTGGSAYTYYLDMLKVAGGGKATMSYPSVYSAAGDLATISYDYSTSSLYDYELFAGDSMGNVLTGVHFSSVITEAGEYLDTFDVELIEYQVGTLDTITFTIVPEPMTVALIGVGGLLLRRRMKK